jgi:hypothetical protein
MAERDPNLTGMQGWNTRSLATAREFLPSPVDPCCANIMIALDESMKMAVRHACLVVFTRPFKPRQQIGM